MNWDFGAASRLIRLKSSLRQEDVAELTGLSQAFLSMLESGARRLTNTDKIAEFLIGLAVPDALVQMPLPGRQVRVAAALPPARDTGHGAIWEDPLSIAQRARRMAAANVDSATLFALQQSMEDIVERYEAEGPQSLAPRTLEVRGLLHELLLGTQHPRQRHELYLLAAKASGLLGYMAVNAGRLPTARSYCAEALQLATEADDHSLIAWIRGTQSLEAYYDGRYAEAHETAAAGVGGAAGSPQAIRLLANGSARALGKLGNGPAAERAAGQALELAEAFDTPAGLTPCISFEPYGRARTLANITTAYVSLGNVHKVLEYADQLDAHIERVDSSWSRALVALDVASALLQQPQPDVEQAMELGRTALQSSRSHPIRSVVQRAQELQQQVVAWRQLPAVREYADALRAWRTQPASYVVYKSKHTPQSSNALEEPGNAGPRVGQFRSLPR